MMTSTTAKPWPARGGHNEFTYDLDQCDRDICTNSARIFQSSGHGSVRCLDVGGGSTTLRDPKSLIGHLSPAADVKVRIFTVNQTFSWSALETSEQMMRAVLQHIDASPAFAQMLHTFGKRRSNSTEANGIPAFIYSPASDRVDCCYLLHIVELHGRSTQDDPWSIRQCAIYERACQRGYTSQFLLVNHAASRSLRQRLKAIRNGTAETPNSGADIHLMLVSSAMMQWNLYCNYLEQELDHLNTKASVDPTTLGKTGMHRIIDFRELQVLHTVQSKIQLTHSALKANLCVIRSVSSDLQARNAVASGTFEAIVANVESHLQRIESLLTRSSTLAIHMHNIISFRSLDDSRKNSGLTADILRLAQDENKELMDISLSAREDTKTLKTITILTLVYLPASFVSETLLSMGYINVEHHGNRASIVFEPEMLIFLVLTCLLLLVTVGMWLFVDRRRKRLRGRHVAQMSKV